MKCIIFDLDGTLVDSIYDITNAINYTMIQIGCPAHSVNEVRSYIGDGARMLVKRAIPKHLYGQLDNILDMYRKRYSSNMLDKTVPFDGIPELISTLKKEGIAVGIASNKPDPDVKKINEVLFNSSFDVALGADEALRARKPAGDIIDAALKALNSEKKECIYVGDSHTDMETAKNAGVKCIIVNWGYETAERLSEADYISDSCTNLLSLIHKLQK